MMAFLSQGFFCLLRQSEGISREYEENLGILGICQLLSNPPHIKSSQHNHHARRPQQAREEDSGSGAVETEVGVPHRFRSGQFHLYDDG